MGMGQNLKPTRTTVETGSCLVIRSYIPLQYCCDPIPVAFDLHSCCSTPNFFFFFTHQKHPNILMEIMATKSHQFHGWIQPQNGLVCWTPGDLRSLACIDVGVQLPGKNGRNSTHMAHGWAEATQHNWGFTKETLGVNQTSSFVRMIQDSLRIYGSISFFHDGRGKPRSKTGRTGEPGHIISTRERQEW